jgi:predicted regulator of Ras-like GTPase activity (Roadblock/LC7/MglB family)
MEVDVMDTEVYSFALKNTLHEIQNICPDIKNAFMFREDGEIVAGDTNTPETTVVRVIDAFDGVFEKADALGGVEGITLDGSKGRVSVSCINDLYLVTVTTKKADMNYVNTVTRVLIPTVLKLIEKISPAPLKNNLSEPGMKPEIPTERKPEELLRGYAEETVAKEPREPVPTEIKPDAVLPEPPISQFIVENIGGLLVPSDTVRVDNELISQWNELYPGKEIIDVEIETFGGKSARCKIKPIKESKYEGKGILQMPDKIQSTLEIKKGELVRVKPIVE